MNDTYARLSNTLDILLAEREHTIEPAPSGTEPLLLLLNAKPDLIGFAQLNGEKEIGFATALEKFKSLYVVRSNEWSDCDLTLVICSTHREDEEAFWTKKELDPYFCRKFVIDSNGTMEADLARLPFVPLRPEKVVGLARPPSAQTLLMGLGVSSRLAEGLAVPHRLGEKRIIEESLKDRKSPPKIQTDVLGLSNQPQSLNTSRVRLKEIEISDFRAYRGNRKFNLNSDLIVLYGPNGLGKTSFFDAIDFVCTGGVTRFDERFGRRVSRLLESLKHLDSKKGESHVKAIVGINGKDITIERWLHDRTNASVNGSTQNRTDTLVSLAALSGATFDMRIENLVRLFRATHLFGQEFQTLTSDLRNNSRLPEDTVSRMLAFQDYVEAINKTGRVSKEIGQQKERSDFELRSLRTMLAEKESEQGKFDNLKKAVETPESISTLGRELMQRLNTETDLELDLSSAMSTDDVKSWRVILEGVIASTNDQLVARRALLPKLSELAQLRESLAHEKVKTIAATSALREIDAQCAKRKQALDLASARRQEMLKNESQFTSSRDNLSWLLRNVGDYRALESQINNAQAEIEKETRRVAELNETLTLEAETTRNQSKEVLDLESRVTRLNESLSAMKDLEKQFKDWGKVNDRLLEVEKGLKSGGDFTNARRAEIDLKLKDSNRLEESRKEYRKAIQEKQLAQSDFAQLLQKLENYVVDESCPACGARHHSRAHLLDAIHERAGVPPEGLAELISNEETVTAALSLNKQDLTELERQIEITGLEMQQLTDEQKDLKGQLNYYNAQARKLELPEDRPDCESKAVARIQAESKSLETTRNALLTKQSEAKNSQDRTALISKERDEANRDLSTRRAAVAKLREILKAIGEEAVSRQLSLNRDQASIESELEVTAQQLLGLRTSMETQDLSVSEAQQQYNLTLQKQQSASKSVDAAKNRERQLGKSTSAIESELSRNGLKPKIEAAELASIVDDQQKRLTSLESLREEVSGFEVVLDAAQMSATSARLKRERDGIDKRRIEVETELKLCTEWETYFSALTTELELVQKRSLQDYVEKYGPLASSIQKRLRSVYGFGDLRLHQEKGGIALRVKRKGGEYVSPTDYFSESQIQIVMLSLFLSAVLTQTWSAFAPILLDDPVTHFDDLNAYSFLDVIRGLIERPSEGHQFILSTCEERLYRLMRQKFAKLPGKVIYYEFESIGEDGPVVREA